VILDLYYDGEWNDVRQESFELAVSFTATLVSDLARRSEGHLFFATNKAPEDSVYAPVGMPAQYQVLQCLTFAAPSKQDKLGETLLRIPAHHHSEIIFITVNSVDVQTSSRFKELNDDSRYRGLLKRFHVVNTSDESLSEIFNV
jgi:hypothetical protein